MRRLIAALAAVFFPALLAAEELRLLFCGDFLISVGVERRALTISSDYPSGGIREIMRAFDYVFVNQQGDVCISFDGDKGFSGDVNLNQVHHQDANQVLLASIDKQQSQLQELSMQRAQSQNQSPTMSI